MMKDGLYFTPMIRLLEIIPTSEWSSRATAYATKLADALEKYGYNADARLVRNHIAMRNGENVAMATMDDYEYNAQVEKERAEYHKKRSEESPAYKAACEAVADLAYEKQIQMAQVCSAISGGGYTKVEKPKPSILPQDVSFDEYNKALKEYLLADIEFDKKKLRNRDLNGNNEKEK